MEYSSPRNSGHGPAMAFCFYQAPNGSSGVTCETSRLPDFALTKFVPTFRNKLKHGAKMELFECQLVSVLAELIVSPNTANRKEAKFCIESDTQLCFNVSPIKGNRTCTLAANLQSPIQTISMVFSTFLHIQKTINGFAVGLSMFV